MRTRLLVVALCCLGLAACSSDPSGTAVTVSPSPTVDADRANDLINVTRCNAYKAQISANRQLVAVEEAAGHTEAVTRVQAEISSAITKARAIAGCAVT